MMLVMSCAGATAHHTLHLTPGRWLCLCVWGGAGGGGGGWCIAAHVASAMASPGPYTGLPVCGAPLACQLACQLSCLSIRLVVQLALLQCDRCMSMRVESFIWLAFRRG